MLFRIAKIFSQNGLKQLIRNAESGLERLGAVTTGFGSLDYLDGMPSLLNITEVGICKEIIFRYSVFHAI